MILAATFVVAIVAWWPEIFLVELGPPLCDRAELCVVFLNVGQGDSIFIQSPSGVQVLVDAGRDSSVLRQLSKIMSFTDRDLDYVLMTHPDADHIGGFAELFPRYSILNVIRTENKGDSDLWQSLILDIEKESSSVYFARRGQVYDLGARVFLEILFPDIDATELESNISSIVARLVYKNVSFMLTGDSPKTIEEYLAIVEEEKLKSNVLKVGHHGSRTSTAELFLDEVSPQYAIISAGKDNSYGHPHLEVTDLLFNKKIKTLSTAERGNIVFQTNGDTVIQKSSF